MRINKGPPDGNGFVRFAGVSIRHVLEERDPERGICSSRIADTGYFINVMSLAVYCAPQAGSLPA